MKRFLYIIILLAGPAYTAYAQQWPLRWAQVPETSFLKTACNLKNSAVIASSETPLPFRYSISARPLPAAAYVPAYCLARGAVICRLEEYVQLHAPLKLNIGLGGE